MSKEKSQIFAVVRIRSSIDNTVDIKHTLALLNLTRPNHAVLVPNDGTHKGMLQKVKDLVTWGEINKNTLTELIKKRGRIKGNKIIDNAFLKECKFASITDFISAVFEGKADIRKIEGLKPIFRLHPPKKGYKDVKSPVAKGGAVGYRGEEINSLLEKMI